MSNICAPLSAPHLPPEPYTRTADMMKTLTLFLLVAPVILALPAEQPKPEVQVARALEEDDHDGHDHDEVCQSLHPFGVICLALPCLLSMLHQNLLLIRHSLRRLAQDDHSGSEKASDPVRLFIRFAALLLLLTRCAVLC